MTKTAAIIVGALVLGAIVGFGGLYLSHSRAPQGGTVGQVPAPTSTGNQEPSPSPNPSPNPAPNPNPTPTPKPNPQPNPTPTPPPPGGTNAKLPTKNLTNVSYGSNPIQKFDFYTASMHPTTFVLFIHGGGWDAGSKETFSDVSQWFASKGFPTANMDYRKTPMCSEETDDVRSAMAYLQNNYGAQQIILAGHSAGAHLAMLTTLAKNSGKLPCGGSVPYPSVTIAAAIGMSGPYDSSLLDGNGIASFNKMAGSNPAAADVVNYADSSDPQVLLIAGSRDSLGPWQASESLHNKMPSNSEYHLLSGVGHNEVTKPWTPTTISSPTYSTAGFVAAFLDRLF